MCFPDPPPTPVTAVLDRAGYPWRAIATPESADSDEPEDGWSGAVICSGDDPAGAFLVCRQLRKREVPLAPVIVVVRSSQLTELELREDLFDDICLEPVNSDELTTRLAHVPDETVLYPGHLYSAEPSATMGDTRAHNYVFRLRTPEQWMAMFGS